MKYKNVTCKHESCSLQAKNKGYCLKHYFQIIRAGNVSWRPKCIAAGCEKTSYALGFCHRHYCKKKYIVMTKKCEAPNCETRISKHKKYCSSHRKRIEKGLPLDLSINCLHGKYNIHWNGGVSEYPNHAKLKRNRKLRFKLVRGRCEDCNTDLNGKRYYGIHLNKDKSDHALTNLKITCNKCFFKYRTNSHKKGKYRKMGIDVKSLSQELGIQPSILYRYFNKKEYESNLKIIERLKNERNGRNG